MSFNFSVQMAIKNPSSDTDTVISVADLGNTEIKHYLSPLISRTEEGYIPSCGELPIDEDSKAFIELSMLNEVTTRDYHDLGDQLEELIASDPLKLWDYTYTLYLHLDSFLDQLRNAIRNIKDVTNNPHISCRIVWTR